jgi:hypothetical protein
MYVCTYVCVCGAKLRPRDAGIILSSTEMTRSPGCISLDVLARLPAVCMCIHVCMYVCMYVCVCGAKLRPRDAGIIISSMR